MMLRAVGIDFSFAPVLDLNWGHSSVIGNRAISRSADTVSSVASALVSGAHDGGAIAVGKHFPGHGYATQDSHDEMCTDERSYAQMADKDLRAFTQVIERGLDAIMTAHIRLPYCHAKTVTYSRWWIQDILRKKLKFHGLIMSDDLTMAGARLSEEDKGDATAIGKRALAALAAGHDLLLVCQGSVDIAGEVLAELARQRAKAPAYHHHIVMRPIEALSWEELNKNKRYQGAQIKLASLMIAGS